MNVHVKLFGVFRSAARTSELNLQIPDENATVKAAISQLIATDSFASLKQLLMDNEMADGLETKLTEDDELSLLPVAHGG